MYPVFSRICLWPGLAVLLLVGQLLVLWVEPESLLSDPGTGHQLRTGQILLQTGHLVTREPYTWTHPGQPWVVYDWLSDLIYAAVQAVAGLPGVVGFAGLLFGLVPVILYRFLIGRGIWPLLALGYGAAVLVVLQAHVLARPHAFTYLFFTGLVAVGGLPLGRSFGFKNALGVGILFAVWANLHGGFVAGLVYGAAAASGRCLDAWRWGSSLRWRMPFQGAVLLAVAAAATLLNPYGLELQRSVFRMLHGHQAVHYMQEFQSPDFFNPNLLTLGLLTVVLALMGLQILGGLRHLRWSDRLPLLVFLYFSFQAQRHIPLLLIVAAWPLMRGVQSVLRPVMGAERCRRWAEERKSQVRSWGEAWALPFVMVLFFWLATGHSSWRNVELGRGNVTAGAVRELQRAPERYQRMLTTTRTGGVAIYYLWPHVRVGHDDRNDVYGDEENLAEFRMLSLASDWQKTLGKLAPDSALLNRGDILEEGLRRIPGWRVTYEDDVTIVLVREVKP